MAHKNISWLQWNCVSEAYRNKGFGNHQKWPCFGLESNGFTKIHLSSLIIDFTFPMYNFIKTSNKELNSHPFLNAARFFFFVKWLQHFNNREISVHLPNCNSCWPHEARMTADFMSHLYAHRMSICFK